MTNNTSWMHKAWTLDGMVCMCGPDEYYVQEFNTADEVDAFIALLVAARDECFAEKA